MPNTNVFDIIGPIMIGPSSSHTAGAVRLGRLARAIAGSTPTAARIRLYGSFAQTYRGHGTDRALVAGLLGHTPADERIRHALDEAKNKGIAVTIRAARGEPAHPNTARFDLTTPDGRRVSVVGASIGGGSVRVTQIDDYDMEISGDYHTLLVRHIDRPGMIATVTALLAKAKVNVAQMRVSRKRKGGHALMTIKADQHVAQRVRDEITGIDGVAAVRSVEPIAYY